MTEKRFPNESDEYRKARNDLLAEEADLRARIERVAVLRRNLPPGGEVPEDYVFGGTRGPVKLSEMFIPPKDTLFLYGFMYGPKQENACPLCTSFLDSLDRAAPHLEQRIHVAVVARSPIERITSFARERGWSNLRLLSSVGNDYPRHYGTEDENGNAWPMAHVFVKRGGNVRHFWGSELFYEPYGDGDTRHIDLMWPIWNVFDTTPVGRGDWYPKLSYDE